MFTTAQATYNTHDVLTKIMELEAQVKALTELILIHSFGLHGHQNLTTGQSSTAGKYYGAIVVLEDSTIDYVETNTGTVSNFAVKQNDIIYGTFSSVTVDAGKVRLYKKDLKTTI